MATIRNLSNSKFRTEIRKFQSTIKTKTFPTRQQAEKWGNKLDKQVNAILRIKPGKLKNLSYAGYSSYFKWYDNTITKWLSIIRLNINICSHRLLI